MALTEISAGQAIVNSLLPAELRDYSRILDKKGINSLLAEVASRFPDRYREISHALTKVGHLSAYRSGGHSFSLADMRTGEATKRHRAALVKELGPILDNDSLSDTQRDELIVKRTGAHMDDNVRELLAESLAEGNPLGLQLKGAGRGNPTGLSSLRGSDFLYVDHRDNLIPVPVLHNYSEGLRPAEYWAASYGGRKGVVDTKTAVRDAGALSKVLNQVVHRGVVIGLDEDMPPDTLRGLPVDTDDDDNEGSLLAHTVGGYPRNTILTPKILKHLRQKEIKSILVRSPITSTATDGGLYARDVGVRERGGLPSIGEDPAMTAAQSFGEPLAQGSLCVAEGTMVRMADFSARPIELIKEGDFVFGSDIRGNTFPVRVTKTYDNGIKDCVKTVFREGPCRTGFAELISTPDHKVLAQRIKWGLPHEIKDYGLFSVSEPCVKLNAMLPSIPDMRRNYFGRVKQEYVGECHTFDIEVEHPDHLFVLANGLIISNSSKHRAGVGGGGGNAVSGFDRIESLVAVPSTFPSGATHAELDGRVQHIETAPAGGFHVLVDGKQHYISVGQNPTVAVGDNVEAGDPISDGFPNPAELVRHKGIGEGKRQFVHLFKTAMSDAGIRAHRRNVELLAHGLINHVRLTDELGDGVPDDIVPYGWIEHHYTPRDNATEESPDSAVGKYMEKPYLHYSIGTKIKPSMLPTLKEFGIKKVHVHSEPPPFEPEMVRGSASLSHDPDWMTRMLGSGLKASLLDSARRGLKSDEASTSYVPGLAKAVDFGRRGVLRTPDKPFPTDQP